MPKYWYHDGETLVQLNAFRVWPDDQSEDIFTLRAAKIYHIGYLDVEPWQRDEAGSGFWSRWFDYSITSGKSNLLRELLNDYLTPDDIRELIRHSE